MPWQTYGAKKLMIVFSNTLEGRRAYQAAYYQAHREEQRVYKQTYYQAHREERLVYSRAYDQTHREDKKKRRDERKQRLNELKLYRGCCSCGYNAHFLALAFHHTESGKEINISAAANQGWSWARIEAELEKCDVICHNCHAIEHWS